MFASRVAGFALTATTGFKQTRAARAAVALLYALCLGLAGAHVARAAEAYSADAVKAEFLYRFAGYVEWPADLPADAPFTIAVAGADGVFAELTRLVPGRTIQNHPVEIRNVSAIADLARVQILYLPPHRHGTRALLAAATGRPILIVSDQDGGLSSGSTVNFVEMDRHVRFEISLVAAERSGLKINSGLLSVAARVEGVRPHADTLCWQRSALRGSSACQNRAALMARAGQRFKPADGA
jgi:hypothetical protein